MDGIFEVRVASLASRRVVVGVAESRARCRAGACLLCLRTSARARRARPVVVSSRTPPRRRTSPAPRGPRRLLPRATRRPPRPLVSRPRRTARSSGVARARAVARALARARRRSPPSARRRPGRTPRRRRPPRACTANLTGRSPRDVPRASRTSSPRARSGRTSCTTPGPTAATRTPPRDGVIATAWASSTPSTGARGRPVDAAAAHRTAPRRLSIRTSVTRALSRS